MPTNGLFHDPITRPARARVVSNALNMDGWGGADPFGLRAPPLDPGSRRMQRLGTALFWAAVSALIVARVVLFDPSATRPAGSLPVTIEQAAPTAR